MERKHALVLTILSTLMTGQVDIFGNQALESPARADCALSKLKIPNVPGRL